jgi:hypothetical protein
MNQTHHFARIPIVLLLVLAVGSSATAQSPVNDQPGNVSPAQDRLVVFEGFLRYT